MERKFVMPNSDGTAVSLLLAQEEITTTKVHDNHDFWFNETNSSPQEDQLSMNSSETNSCEAIRFLSPIPTITVVKSKAKNFVCGFEGCESAFTTSSHLNRHQLKHNQKKAHTCIYEGCFKAFSRKDNMKQHFKTHNKLKQSRQTKNKGFTTAASPYFKLKLNLNTNPNPTFSTRSPLPLNLPLPPVSHYMVTKSTNLTNRNYTTKDIETAKALLELKYRRDVK